MLVWEMIWWDIIGYVVICPSLSKVIKVHSFSQALIKFSVHVYDVIYRYHIYVIIPTYYNSGTQTSTFADRPRVNSWIFLWFHRIFIIFNSLRSKWKQNSSYYDLKWARFRVHVIGEIYIENLYIWRIESFCIVIQRLWHTCMSKTWSWFKLKYFKICQVFPCFEF